MCGLMSEAVFIQFSDVHFQPFEIESKSGFDPNTYCLGDMKLIFPVVIICVAIGFSVLTALALYNHSQKQKLTTEVFHEL
ncbi:Oidioi.mRNA.OKI2018_I69.PAR.g10398.t1.cds [Oikopleura dioica]|uniref:Oidioi.mRNA.OKI2018_I69.PAR.g10398.t1.cds n=1 Tax=Oikopleura dioica TaxID=34765 RepID=A0ABN7RTX4_OIKDI|nr:Oidioi.mRNA.OKI2018_I69.PAR.g10398.t1.cds [Oikopleura dioica]